MREDMEKSTVESKEASLTVREPDALYPIAKALASRERLTMIRLLGSKSMNVNELAKKMNIPMSSAAMHVRILEDNGLIMSEIQPGVRGAMKLCSRRLDYIAISLLAEPRHNDAVLSLQMPVGGYSQAVDISATCGLASETSPIGMYDNPQSFYLPDRLKAQLIWFRHGFVVYDFGILSKNSIHIKWLEVSFEACSEAPLYRDPWKSDISVSINDREIGIWTSPCDFGGRRGRLNPSWWSDVSTQYGTLKTWRVDENGSCLENARISGVTLNDLALRSHDHVSVRIGVSPKAENVGGINLFGEQFGDHAQAIVLRVGYEPLESSDIFESNPR